MRTSPTWMLPFTLRVMMRPLSRPSRTRTFTWTASPVIPVRPTTSTTSAGMLSSSAIVSPRPSEASALPHRAKLAGQVVEHRLRLARVQDGDGRSRLADELGLAAFDEFRDLVRPLADLPAFLRQLDRLIRLVDQVFRHLETDVHRLGHRGDLLPPRGRGAS